MQNKEIKLVIIFWDLGIGGIQTRFSQIIKEVLRERRSIKVYLLLKRKMADEISLPSSSKLEIRYFDNRRIYNHGQYESQPTNFGLWIIWQLILINPTHLLTFLCRYSTVAFVYRFISKIFLRKFRFIINEGIYTSNYLNQHEEFYWKYIVSLVYKKADSIIVPTEAIKRDLVTNFKIPSELIVIIRSWVKQQKFKKIKKIYSGIFVGRLAPEKGLRFIVNLAKLGKRDNLKFCIVGDGELKNWLLGEIYKFNLHNLTYLGYREDVIKTVSQSRFLLLPSYNEGLPMTILEANSVAVPAIITSFSGSNEAVINGRTGFIFNPKQYVKETLHILKDKNKTDFLAKNSQMFCKKRFNSNNLNLFIREVLLS